MAAFVREAKRVEEDSLYSAKSHFEAGRRWSRVHLWLGLPAAALSAIAGGSAFGGHDVLAGSLALVVAGLTAVMTFLSPDDKASRHQLAGARYNAVRNSARVFYEVTVLRGGADLSTQLASLCERRDTLNLESPQIAGWAFQKGRKAIESGEASYQVDRDK